MVKFASPITYVIQKIKKKLVNNLNYRLQHQKNITRYIISNVSSTFDAELFSSTFDVKLIWNCVWLLYISFLFSHGVHVI